MFANMYIFFCYMYFHCSVLADSLRYQSITIQPEYRHLSFEELRFATKGKRRRSKKDQKKEGEELNQAHYLMLELFLSSEVFRSDVRKLVIMPHPLLIISLPLHVYKYSQTSEQRTLWDKYKLCCSVLRRETSSSLRFKIY